LLQLKNSTWVGCQFGQMRRVRGRLAGAFRKETGYA